MDFMPIPLFLAAGAFLAAAFAPKAAKGATVPQTKIPSTTSNVAPKNLPQHITLEQLRPIVQSALDDAGNPFNSLVLLSIAKIESGSIKEKNATFNRKATRYEPHLGESSYGIFQTLASTAKDMGLKGTPTQLFDPAISAQIAIKYLVWVQTYLTRRLGRSPSLREILLSYNGGVGTFLRNRNGTPATKQYVAKYETALTTLTA